jgi:hypothetical protein
MSGSIVVSGWSGVTKMTSIPSLLQPSNRELGTLLSAPEVGEHDSLEPLKLLADRQQIRQDLACVVSIAASVQLGDSRDPRRLVEVVVSEKSRHDDIHVAIQTTGFIGDRRHREMTLLPVPLNDVPPKLVHRGRKRRPPPGSCSSGSDPKGCGKS